jgi:hypothetical protein
MFIWIRNMKKHYSKASSFLAGILFTGGFILRVIWGYSGSNWAYWISNLALGIILFIPGITILVIPDVAVEWLRIFFGLLISKKDSGLSSLGYFPKLVLYTIAIVGFVLGFGIWANTIYQIYNGCSPSISCSLF